MKKLLVAQKNGSKLYEKLWTERLKMSQATERKNSKKLREAIKALNKLKSTLPNTKWATKRLAQARKNLFKQRELATKRAAKLARMETATKNKKLAESAKKLMMKRLIKRK